MDSKPRLCATDRKVPWTGRQIEQPIVLTTFGNTSLISTGEDSFASLDRSGNRTQVHTSRAHSSTDRFLGMKRERNDHSLGNKEVRAQTYSKLIVWSMVEGNGSQLLSNNSNGIRGFDSCCMLQSMQIQMSSASTHTDTSSRSSSTCHPKNPQPTCILRQKGQYLAFWNRFRNDC